MEKSGDGFIKAALLYIETAEEYWQLQDSADVPAKAIAELRRVLIDLVEDVERVAEALGVPYHGYLNAGFYTAAMSNSEENILRIAYSTVALYPETKDQIRDLITVLNAKARRWAPPASEKPPTPKTEGNTTLSESKQRAIDAVITSTAQEIIVEVSRRAASGSSYPDGVRLARLGMIYQFLIDELIPRGEKKIRDYYLAVGVYEPAVIGEGVRRFLHTIGQNGHGLAAAHQAGNPGMAQREAMQFEAHVKAIASGAETRAVVEVERIPLTARRTQEVSPMGTKIFIGHGRSPVWREFRDFIERRLNLQVDEFDSVATAGMLVANRLLQMKNEAGMAFVIMTAEDEQPDKKVRARQNVVHEIGFFQGALGFERAIVLLEDGCEKFSNIDGIVYIGFNKDHVDATFEKIRMALEREKFVPPLSTAPSPSAQARPAGLAALAEAALEEFKSGAKGGQQNS